jgi:hypothetical protein
MAYNIYDGGDDVSSREHVDEEDGASETFEGGGPGETAEPERDGDSEELSEMDIEKRLEEAESLLKKYDQEGSQSLESEETSDDEEMKGESDAESDVKESGVVGMNDDDSPESLYACPVCKFNLSFDATVCPNCGSLFDG